MFFLASTRTVPYFLNIFMYFHTTFFKICEKAHSIYQEKFTPSIGEENENEVLDITEYDTYKGEKRVIYQRSYIQMIHSYFLKWFNKNDVQHFIIQSNACAYDRMMLSIIGTKNIEMNVDQYPFELMATSLQHTFYKIKKGSEIYWIKAAEFFKRPEESEEQETNIYIYFSVKFHVWIKKRDMFDENANKKSPILVATIGPLNITNYLIELLKDLCPKSSQLTSKQITSLYASDLHFIWRRNDIRKLLHFLIHTGPHVRIFDRDLNEKDFQGNDLIVF